VKVLLDENLPHALRKHLPKHEVETAAYSGLAGYKNGALLKAAIEAGFDVVVTGDQTLQYEQNLADQKIALVSLSAIAWRILKNDLGKIAGAVDNATPGSLVRVECGKFSRGNKLRDSGLG
jgi:hypothetical protein